MASVGRVGIADMLRLDPVLSSIVAGRGAARAAARLLSSLAVAVVLAGALGGPAMADGSVPVPRGFKLMCMDFPAECRGGGAKEVKYNSTLAALLQKVNADVNRRIKPIKNEVIDVWSINVTSGDCEDYVLAKRRALISAGVAASALSIVYVKRNGGGHAILAVHTDKGSFALDNMSRRIKPLTDTGYKLVSMSGPNPMVWTRVEPFLIASK